MTVELELDLPPLVRGKVTLRVPEERAEATREALAILEGVRWAGWEQGLRDDRAGVPRHQA
jgi:hypothetical protein